VQLMLQVKLIYVIIGSYKIIVYAAHTVYELLMMGDKRPKHVEHG
jgi:hypothetical protein